MVIEPSNAVSRASSLTLVGGELAFDFANTSSGRGWPSFQEHLQRPRDVVDWARHARVLPPADAEALIARLALEPALAAELLERALELREAVYRIARELGARHAPPKPEVDRLSAIYADCIKRAHLAPDESRFAWSWTPAESPVEAVLGPIALSALTTLAQADLTRVKQCQGEKCGWVFFDTTKNKSRRWCEMEVCGNRAKQRRHVARARGA